MNTLLAQALAVPEASAPALAPNIPPPSYDAPQKSAAPIIARNPFDSKTGPLDRPPVAPDIAPVPQASPCDAGRVVLIALSAEPAWSFAAISLAGKRVLRRRGDDLEGRTIESIEWDRVWLVRNGARCRLRLGDEDASEAKARSASEKRGKRATAVGVPHDIASKIRKLGEHEYSIDRAAFDRILEMRAELMAPVRWAPSKRRDAHAGMRISRLPAGSLLGLLGLRRGDEIRSINGVSLADPEKALGAYARLRASDRLTLSLLRGGKDTNIAYRVD